MNASYWLNSRELLDTCGLAHQAQNRVYKYRKCIQRGKWNRSRTHVYYIEGSLLCIWGKIIKGTISAPEEFKQVNRYLLSSVFGIMLEASMGSLGTNWRDLTYSCFFFFYGLLRFTYNHTCHPDRTEKGNKWSCIVLRFNLYIHRARNPREFF